MNKLRLKGILVLFLIESMLISEPGVLQAAELSNNSAAAVETAEVSQDTVSSEVQDSEAANEAEVSESEDALQEPESESNDGVTGDMSDIAVEGSSGFGEMLSEGIVSKETEQINNDGYNIFSISMSGNKASVDYETKTDCTILVCLYNETNTKLIASGKAEVSADSTNADVSIDTGTVPAYFYLRGYLVDTDSLRPLGTEYASPMYTREMQEFLAKTTADFPADKVVNLDDDTKNNFVVADDATKVIRQSGSYNQVVSEDEVNNVYVIDNANDDIKSLSKNETFVYQVSDDNILVVKVAGIEISGNKVTIKGENTSLEDTFSYIKIDGSQDASQAEIDNTGLEEGVSYTGLSDNEPADGLENAGAEGEVSDSSKLSYEFKKDESKKITGSVALSLGASVKYYIAADYQYIEVKLDWELESTVELEFMSAEKDITLSSIKFMPVPAIVLSVDPKFCIKASAKVSLSVKLSGTVGISWASDSGFRNLTTKPELSAELKVEGEVFVGIGIEPNVSIIDEHILMAGIEGKAGVDISGEMSTASQSKNHACGSQCISGEVDAVIKCEAELTILNHKGFKMECDALRVKIKDWYYSLMFDDFGFTTCPHIFKNITIQVKDSSGKVLAGCTVFADSQSYTTDKYGAVTPKLSNGKYLIKVTKKGYKAITKAVNVNGEAKKIAVTLPAKSGGAETITRVSMGAGYAAALTDGGNLYTWGRNGYGQLGNGDSKVSSSKTPIYIMGDVKDMSVGIDNGAAITADGSLYTWGYYPGDGTDGSKYAPTSIMSGTAFKDVSCGYRYIAALTTKGKLYTWGAGGEGQLGNGSTTTTYETELIRDVPAFKMVSCGDNHMAAIADDGSLYMWGHNVYGQLGTGNTATKYVPTKIMAGTVFKDVSCGGIRSNYSSFGFTAAITSDGDLYTWGSDSWGELGNGTAGPTLTPTRIMAGTKFNKVSCGMGHVLAAAADGSLYSWGYNRAGQLGDGSFGYSENPIKIEGNVTDAAGISAGGDSSVAVTSSGELYTWGDNNDGQLGDGTTSNRCIPRLITIDPSTSAAGSVEAAGVADTDIEAVGAASSLPRYYNESTSAGVASFSGLSANALYNIYDMKSETAADPLSGDNLLTVSQASADADGKISINYEQRETYDGDKVFAVGQYAPSIADADVSIASMSYNGAEQLAEAVVKYNGTLLTEGVDYEIGGQYSATDAGEYTAVIYGMGNYAGSKPVKYSIYNETVPSAKTCTVSFDPQGGSSVAAQTYALNAAFVLPAAPTRDGYDFAGWFTEKSAGTQFTASTTVTVSVTLYAHWTASGKTPTPTPTTPSEDKTAIDLSTADTVISPIKDCTYTGSPAEPVLTVKYRKTKLEEGVDYTVSYNNNTDAGTASAVITGISNYSGMKSGQFKIKAKKLKQSQVEILVPDAVMSGNRAEPEISIFDRSRDEYLVRGTDYTVEYSNNTGAGKGKAVITAVKNYAGSVTKTYNIYAAGTKLVGNLNFKLGSDANTYAGYELQAARTLTGVSCNYDGRAQRPSVTVTDAAGNAVDKKYYLISYRSNKNAGHAACVVIKGKKDYKGSAMMYFTIVPAELSSSLVTFNTVSDRTYTGSAIKPKPVIKHTGLNRKLRLNRDFTVKYAGNADVGTAVITVTGIGNYRGTASTAFNIKQKDIKYAAVKGLGTQTYTGSQIKPAGFTVYMGRHQLKEGRDFTLSYGANTEKGKGTVTLTGMGNLSGTVTKSFRIK